jgi:hypothetical protein
MILLSMKIWIIIALTVVLVILRSTVTSGYACASTRDNLSVHAQGGQCYRCEGDWDGGDCIKSWPGGGRTRGTVSVYDASSTVNNEMPGWLFRWDDRVGRPNPAYPPLWR